jgi:hypothetical protein
VQRVDSSKSSLATRTPYTTMSMQKLTISSFCHVACFVRKRSMNASKILDPTIFVLTPFLEYHPRRPPPTNQQSYQQKFLPKAPIPRQWNLPIIPLNPRTPNLPRIPPLIHPPILLPILRQRIPPTTQPNLPHCPPLNATFHPLL